MVLLNQYLSTVTILLIYPMAGHMETQLCGSRIFNSDAGYATPLNYSALGLGNTITVKFTDRFGSSLERVKNSPLAFHGLILAKMILSR